MASQEFVEHLPPGLGVDSGRVGHDSVQVE